MENMSQPWVLNGNQGCCLTAKQDTVAELRGVLEDDREEVVEPKKAALEAAHPKAIEENKPSSQ
eukprot:2742709-Amphidinium_carterae.1